MFLRVVSLLIFTNLLKVNVVSCVCEDSFMVICNSLEDVMASSERYFWTELLIQNTIGVFHLSLTKRNLNNIPHLRRLIIVNHVNKIEPLFFDQFESITRITLYDNDLKTLEAKTFTKLEKLEELDLRNNAIEHMESLSISFCKIDTVDLSHNSLRTLISEIFQGSVIKKLVITHNKLSKIEGNAMPLGLKFLNLEYNEFQSFSLPNLNRSSTVTDLKLSHNKLYTVDVFHLYSSIETLDLSFNNLYTFDIHILDSGFLIYGG